MDFGDDPLADLSDGSNDSFFDEPKSSTKRASLTKTPEKKSVTDIFNTVGKSLESGIASKKSDDWLGLDVKETKSPSRTQKLTKKISFEDDDDLLGNLGFSKRPPSRSETSGEENRPSKKVDLLGSILGPSKTEEADKKPSFEDILKESKAKTALFKGEEPAKKSTYEDIYKESKTKVSSASSTPKPSFGMTDSLPFSSDAPREGRRGRRPSTGLMDPLGLFSNEAKQEDSVTVKEKPSTTNLNDALASKAVHSKSTPNISNDGLPDWLGGTTIKHSKSENVLHQPKPIDEPKSQPESAQPEVVKQESLQSLRLTDKDKFENEESQATLNSILTQQKLAHSHMEYQNTAIALQQQESQLLIALQLKKYEENLSEMQQKQQELLMKQEQQFNLLLERQFTKQQIMENNMRLQQERINNHIQMLIAQPPVARNSSQEEMIELKKTASEETVKVYENMISSLKERQHEEVFLLEESYKKQISLMEQSLESVEKRLKMDAERLSEAFEEKVKLLLQQHDDEIVKYKQKIQEIEVQHSEEIKQIRDNNSRVIEEIKYEHATLLENIKDAKKSESTLFQETGSYIQKLDSNIEILYANSKNLVELKDHIDKDYGILSRAREETLRAKEQEILSMKATLEKCRESAEKERAELLTLVRTLETKIAEQNQNTREERWAFQQAASTLTARSAAMDREAEFNRAAIEREREQLKTLKESILAEREKMVLQLTEEKLQLSAEKSRLETSSKLMMNYDSQKAKSEIEAAVQIARDAAEMTDKERESLHREKCEVEKLKRTLRDHERKLSLRESELENLIRDAEQKKSEGEKAILEAKSMESKFNERLRDLQNQLMALSSREKKLAEEKIALSKERLAINTMVRQNKKCSLCSADPQKLDDTNFNVNSVNLIRPYFPRFDNVDNDIIRLRLEAVDESLLKIEETVPI